MPAQKRSSPENSEEESPQREQSQVKEEPAVEENEEEAVAEEEEQEEEEQPEEEQEQQEDEDEEDEDEEDSNGSRSSKDGDNDEYVTVNLAEIRKEVQCPICLGIIRKTRTVMECLHRFCRECIDKSMRMGNNECPACRTHCASRRSLRDDPNYDALIAALYHDIDKYEAEELAFKEEEKTRNQQIQASIAQTFQRQTEALGRKRTTAKAVAQFMRRSRGRRRRGRAGRNTRGGDLQISDDDDTNCNEDGRDRDESSADEPIADVKPKRCKRWSGSGPGPRFSQGSADGGPEGSDDLERERESSVVSPIFAGSPEVLAWGKGGVRSHTRYGSVSGSNKNGRNNRLAKLVDHLRSSENIDKLNIHLIVIPLDKQTVPSLEEPFLSCKPTLSVGHLCQFVALQTPLEAEDVEILAVKDRHFKAGELSPTIDVNIDKLQLVEEQDTLGELLANSCNGSQMVLVYRQKVMS